MKNNTGNLSGSDRVSAMAATPRFYAELLENIRFIALSINLPSPSNSTTKLDLNSPCLINLHHDGKSMLLNLPGNVTPAAGLALRICKPGEQTLCYRLPVLPSRPLPAETENYVPWTAMELNKEATTLFNCRVCRTEVIPKNRIKTWKDLPSGNWEEMMDFWHCHRPDESHRHIDRPRYAPLQQGYVAESGTALVDLTYFLLAEADCSEAVEVTEPIMAKGDPHVLHCKSCKSILGVVDKKPSGDDSSGASRGWTLYKWALCDEKSKTLPMQCLLAAQLIDLADNGTRRIIFSAQEVKLRVWVFSTDTHYTSSDTNRAIRAVKVFWQPGAGDKGGMMSIEGFEEVAIHKQLLEGLKEAVERGDQKYGEWKVGMVERFEERSDAM
ncbi:ubiquitin-conjugating enzyme E2-binding protein [Tuber borchii]|uniref:Ubiquitin-conjugating enzyme E2-binding protein n=1 Tax=Tuber borchii TaxID=42251 RepID=A0A2T7A9A2_TUBBO|nr:ubiquitin-conjugating enzyme E2-binding protein [Tuber borchii]